MRIEIPVSVGELIDKITILEIKLSVRDNKYIQKELHILNSITISKSILGYKILLKEINQRLWGIEDKLRKKEKLQEFDDEFIELSRSVYKTNDERARIKKEINELTNSEFNEVKIYE
jgi:hypothetical protein